MLNQFINKSWKAIQKYLLLILVVVLLFESVYFNILFDLFLIFLLLTTALALGSFFHVKGKIKNFDRILLEWVLGLGIFGFIIWISTLYNFNYKSLYFAICCIIITLRFKPLLKNFYCLKKEVIKTNAKNNLLFPLILLFIIFAIPSASFPIQQYDALLKHLPIPLEILHKSNYDYNVIENIVYGDYALLSHMLYLFLLSLGGTKSIVLLNLIVSCIILISLTRIAGLINSSNKYINIIILIYITTPAIFYLSTVLVVDLMPWIFIFPVIFLILQDFNRISQNLLLISFLLGLAFFAKQNSMYFIIPIVAILFVYWIIALFKVKNKLKIIGLGLFSILLFALPFLPAQGLIAHKTGNPIFPLYNDYFESPYFATTPRILPFDNNPLGLNIQSLISMVFKTNNNSTFSNYSLGFFLLLLFIVPIALIFFWNRKYALLTAIILASYYLSVKSTPNIRYTMGSIILAIILSSFLFVIIDKITVRLIKNKVISIFIIFTLVLILIIPNILFILKPTNNLLTSNMLNPESKLTINANEDILSHINNPNIKILSNNDVFKGTFKGQFYTINWYNTYFMHKIKRKEITFLEYLKSCDYYLIDKRQPLSPYLPEIFYSLENQTIKDSLQHWQETETHVLYKVKKDIDKKILLEEQSDSPIRINQTDNIVRKFIHNSVYYMIEIEANNISNANYGYVQINWLDKKEKFISVTQVRYKIKTENQSSIIIKNVPKGTNSAVLYLGSVEKEIFIDSFKLTSFNFKKTMLDKELEQYDRKWPHLDPAVLKNTI